MVYPFTLSMRALDNSALDVKINTANDNTVRFVIHVTGDGGEIDYSSLTGASLFFMARAGSVTEAVCTVEPGAIVCDVARGHYAAGGVIQCELQMIMEVQVLAPLRFSFKAQRTIADPAGLVPPDASETFAGMIAHLQGFVDTAQQMILDLQGAGFASQAELAALTGSVSGLAGAVGGLSAAVGALDAAKVNRAGDTMTGPLAVDSTGLDKISFHDAVSYGYLSAGGNGSVSLDARDGDDKNNRRFLLIRSMLLSSSILPAVQLAQTVAGVQTNYNLWGAHNQPIETGNWTPTSKDPAAFIVTTAGMTPFYMRVGRAVYIRAYLSIVKTAVTAYDSIVVEIAGLPFPMDSQGAQYAPLTIGNSSPAAFGNMIRAMQGDPPYNALQIALTGSGTLTVGQLQANPTANQCSFAGWYITAPIS